MPENQSNQSNHPDSYRENNSSVKWLRFLRWFCPDDLYEEIEGDLIQRFRRDAKMFGEQKAKRRLIWNTIRFFRPGIISRNRFSIRFNHSGMFHHFLKIGFRTTIKNGTYSFINVAGLAVGLACTIFILLWAMDEISFDKFHKDQQRIFKVMVHSSYSDGHVDTWDSSSGRLAEGLKEVPEVEQTCRTTFDTRVLFNHRDQSIYENGIYADASIFNLFTFPLKEGNTKNPLPNNNSVAISEKLATHCFNTESAIGKVFRLDNTMDVQVTAVFQDNPDNSSLRFEFVLPYSMYAMRDKYNLEWGAWTGGLTYVKLHEGTNPEIVNNKIRSSITKERIWPRWGTNVDLFLFPVSDWRLYDRFENGKQSGGRITYVRAFSIVAIFTLLIACINFMNLATARSMSRSREVGVRKVVGADRRSLIQQFIGESILISFTALLFSLLIVHLMLPSFNDLTGKRVSIDYTNPVVSGSLLGITLITGVVAGSYPAFFLSSLKAIHVLKGKLSGLSGVGIRKSLVVFQFSLSVILIIGAMVVYEQINYMRNKNLGFDKENTFYFNSSMAIRKSFESFRNESLQNPFIKFVSQGSANPMEINNGLEMGENAWPGKTKTDDVFFQWLHCDYDFLPALGFTFVSGRNFSREFASDSSNFIITEEAAKHMKLSNPVGQQLTVDRKGQIIGVVKDFHSSGLQRPIDPVIITMRPENTTSVFIRYEQGHIEDAMKCIQTVYKKFEPDFPMEYKFMDEPFGRQYQNEVMIGKLSTCFTLIAIFISCLGLFGLASFTAEKRSKEIGVRKVLGATVSQMVILLCRDFVLLIVCALMVGLPVAWWGTKRFLETYQFHAQLTIWVFVITALSMLLVALLTVSYQSAKAALANPVESLRAE